MMKRRSFIYSGVAVATGLAVGSLALQNSEPKWTKQPFLYPFVLSNFLNQESLRAIGRNFLDLRPNENSREKLMKEIISGIQKIKTGVMDPAQDAVNIEKNVQIDFKSEQFILISGWVISETEARQCALLFLS